MLDGKDPGAVGPRPSFRRSVHFEVQPNGFVFVCEKRTAAPNAEQSADVRSEVGRVPKIHHCKALKTVPASLRSASVRGLSARRTAGPSEVHRP